MASFDFIEAAVKGYEFVWRERKYLARVAFPVVFVKVACLFAVISFGVQNMYMLQGLVLFPGYVVEALFMIGLIRYALYGENIFIWGRSFPSENPPKSSIPMVGRLTRAQCVQAGVAVYLLMIVFVLSFTGSIMDYAETLEKNMESGGGTAIPTVLGGIIVMSILAFGIWSFRLFWLYIPIAIGVSISGFLRVIKGLESSVYMIGTWLMCFLPPLVLFGVGMQLIVSIFPEGSEGFIILSSVFRAITDLVVTAIQVAAMTYGFTEILFGSDKKEEK